MVLQMLQCCSCMEGPAISHQGKEEADRLEKAQRRTNESVHYVSRVGFARPHRDGELLMVTFCLPKWAEGENQMPSLLVPLRPSESLPYL